MPRDTKREYQTDIPIIFGTGVAFLVFAIVSLIPPISDWLHANANWLSILALLSFFPGFIMIAVSIGLYYQNTRLKAQVLKAIVSGDYGAKVVLDEIATDYGLTSGDMRRLLVDLRMEQELKVSFDSKTGEVIFPTIGGYTQQTISNGHIYCSYCGLQLSKDTLYCPGCGANLH